MNLDGLKKKIPYKWRVQSFSKFKAQASCVAYIDARDAMDLLDEVCGAENWQDRYSQVAGMLFGEIGIKVSDEWIWKGDTGSESNIEKDKGHVSDAFKRAGVKWGIGRFLYALDIVYLPTDGAKTDKHQYPKVVDEMGKPVWNLTRHINKMREKYNGDIEPDSLTAPMFSAQLQDVRSIFAKKKMTGLYTGFLKDKYGTSNEVELIKNNLKDAQHIIDGLREVYLKGQ